jgi:molybdate transport system substrate-binding protein
MTCDDRTGRAGDIGRRAVLAGGLALVLAGSGGRAVAALSAPVVLAASSLQESLSAAADAFARHGHPRPVISFAASSALARQVEAGAPADLFFPADEDWMDYLQQRRLIRPGSRQALLTNALVLVAPSRSPVRLSIVRGFPLDRALGTGRLAMADPDSVPAGKYGRQALTSLGLWPRIAPRVARAENVRAALALVTRGAAPFGVVFATDARAEPGVRVVGQFPAASHAPISYPLAALARSTNPEAEAFRRFLAGAEARAIFRRFGFGTR